MATPRISAFPKCYLEDIALGRMSLLDWIDMSVELEPDGLELYSGWLQDRSSAALAEVKRRADSYGLPLIAAPTTADSSMPSAAKAASLSVSPRPAPAGAACGRTAR